MLLLSQAKNKQITCSDEQYGGVSISCSFFLKTMTKQLSEMVCGFYHVEVCSWMCVFTCLRFGAPRDADV